MKVLAKPIDMIAWFKDSGKLNPIKFRLEGEDGTIKIIKINKIIKTANEKIAGNPMQIFTCTAIINGVEKIFELKYEVEKCRWYLFKI
ncbi:MAG: hypothetical protein GX275_08640 [Clostridiales bacterium]|nr:hypothetical protein [Clostridiales bacterium]